MNRLNRLQKNRAVATLTSIASGTEQIKTTQTQPSYNIVCTLNQSSAQYDTALTLASLAQGRTAIYFECTNQAYPSSVPTFEVCIDSPTNLATITDIAYPMINLSHVGAINVNYPGNDEWELVVNNEDNVTHTFYFKAYVNSTGIGTVTM